MSSGSRILEYVEKYFSEENQEEKIYLRNLIWNISYWTEDHAEKFIKPYLEKNEYDEKDRKIFKDLNGICDSSSLLEEAIKKENYKLSHFISQNLEVDIKQMIECNYYLSLKYLYEVENKILTEKQKLYIFEDRLYNFETLMPDSYSYLTEREESSNDLFQNKGKTRFDLWKEDIFPGVNIKPAMR